MMQTNDMSDWNDSSDRLWGMGMGGGWELGQSMREDYKSECGEKWSKSRYIFNTELKGLLGERCEI